MLEDGSSGGTGLSEQGQLAKSQLDEAPILEKLSIRQKTCQGQSWLAETHSSLGKRQMPFTKQQRGDVESHIIRLKAPKCILNETGVGPGDRN